MTKRNDSKSSSAWKRCSGATGAACLALAIIAGAAIPAQAAPANQASKQPRARPGGPPPGPSCKPKEFVKRHGSELRLGHDTFRFAGSNNYYLGYKSTFMVDDVLKRAADAGFNVMRTWGAFDLGDPADSSTSFNPTYEGVYYQYWDAAAGEPAYNDGATGMEHLDYVIAKAGELGIRLVIPFVNNWRNFGGMDQYVWYAGGSHHDDFYTNRKIRSWYKKWVSHVLNRTNTVNGIKYKDDPAILSWELANEPRCGNGPDGYPPSDGCGPDTLVRWAAEMSAHVKSIDKNHLLSAGDEGFYCDPDGEHWTETCSDGVDTIALASLPKIDMLSFHLYPDHWGTDPATFGQPWIERHFADALAIGKPAYLGEFGIQDHPDADLLLRNAYFKEWTDTIFDVGGAGGLYWILSGLQDDGKLYPDYDTFTVYCPSPTCATISHHAAMMQADHALEFAPVADHDVANVAFGTPSIVLDPSSNDVAYGGATLLESSIDLDPVTPGAQSSLSLPGASVVATPDGLVTFTPVDGFSGSLEVQYVIYDSKERASNLATLAVTVAQNPDAAYVLDSFEGSTDGFAPIGGSGLVATAESSTDFATQGTNSLKIGIQGSEGWFGTTYAVPLDISDKTVLRWDVRTTDVGYSAQIALQFGDGWQWCDAGDWAWIGYPTALQTAEVPLGRFCEGTAIDLTKVQALYVYVGNNGVGTVYIDNIRAE